jgi:hypothetical protein
LYFFNKYLLILAIYYFFIPLPLHASERSESLDYSNADSANIIVISDTQSPLWVEELFLSSNNNEIARDSLFNHILKSRPKAIFHLGDLVSLGFYDDSWMALDQFLNNLSEFQIPFYPTLGNHELMFFSDEGEKNFISRFPFYSKTGYLKRIGSIAFILLNSNISELTDEEIIQQQNWYRNQLKLCQSDSAIKAIIVGCHHSPFTNSKLVNSNEDVQKYFVPDFIDTEKCKLFLSGHSHSFEHFVKSGKDFLVIGGGGGLQHPLYKGQESLHTDSYEGPLNQRVFHYLNCQIDKNGMDIEIKMLSPDFSTISTIYYIKYNFNENFIVETQ